MDKSIARAASLGLSLYFFKAVPVQLSTIFHLSERFYKYIQLGEWPKEAVEQLGKEEVRKEEREGNESLHGNG